MKPPTLSARVLCSDNPHICIYNPANSCLFGLVLHWQSFSKQAPQNLEAFVDNFKLIRTVNFDVMVLGSSEKGFGFKRTIHIWITTNDYENANLMILLAYIILGHKEWEDGLIKIFALHPEASLDEERERLFELTKSGRLPISPKNIELIEKHMLGFFFDEGDYGQAPAGFQAGGGKK